MSFKRKLAALAASITAPAALAVALAGPAGASTTGCTNGVYAGYCGTQVSETTTPLAWDVYQQKAQVGNKIIAFGDDDSDRALDLYTFAYDGGSTKVFEYAPNGVASNLCVSEPASHAGLVLRTCNGSAWQQFTAAPAASGYTWTDKATGDIVASGGAKAQLTGVTAPGTLTGNDEWTFQG